MAPVSGHLLRRVVAVFGTLGVLGMVLLPPEHAHVAHASDGHHSEVVHRHFESHHAPAGAVTLSDDDDDVVWLDSSFTTPTPPSSFSPLCNLLHERVEQRVAEPTRDRTISASRLSTHDPPWLAASGFRAPPSSSPDLI
jgi:hypothetical protein